LIQTNNPNIDSPCSNIYSGEVLCVSADPLVPNAPQGFFKNQSIATNQNPDPNTPYVPPVNTDNSQGNDGWDAVDPSDVEDGEDIPYCDEVGA
jgi:hypothetical protein